MDQLESKLVSFIKSSYFPEEKLKISKNGTQTRFFKKAGKSLCYIETKNGKSAVTVVIGNSLNDRVMAAAISERVKKIFSETKQFHDGKWLFFELKTERDLEDIKNLLAIKRAPIDR